METLRNLVKSREYGAAWRRLFQLSRSVHDYTTMAELCRIRRKLDAAEGRPQAQRQVRVALLGGASTELLEQPLSLAIESLGLGCVMYRSEFNTIVQEVLGAQSAAADFAPDVAVIVNTAANIPEWPGVRESLEEVRARADRVCAYWLDLCARLHERTGCEVVLNNFHALSTRPLGNLGAKTAWDALGFLRRVNLALGDRAPSYVHINDVDFLAGHHGVRRWFDARYWFHSKQPVSFECLAAYAGNTARIIGAIFGITAKCLVLDLDNTLWGGVIGDDGVEGIQIGEGDPVGEAFKSFQEYILRLKQRGVMLAVCSKNEESNALKPFAEHPGMVLKREDFVAFVANWAPKPDNIIQIASELNIGLNSLVFVDDNPAEREHVRLRLPEVAVVELTADPADYPLILDSAGVLEVAALSAEDQARTQQYQANAERDRLRENVGDYREYLATLQQKAVVRPFEGLHLDRITQLINKSNQFNVTTVRLSRAEVAERMEAADVLTAYVRLADRFGDNGLISVFSGRYSREALDAELWLMSCRVLQRGVEQLLCNHVVACSRERGVRWVRGVYRPTAKNGLVRDLFARLGFEAEGEDSEGVTRWRLDVDRYHPFPVEIEVVKDY